MGSTGTRFGRNFPLEHTYPEQRAAAPDAGRAHGQPRAAHARGVRAGDDAERARRRLAPVRGARLVQPRRPTTPTIPGSSPSTRATPGRSKPMEIRQTPRDASADPGGPQTWCTADTSLVGRLADLRPRQGVHRQDAAARGRQDARRSRTACCPRTSTRASTIADVRGTHWIGLSSCTRSSRSSTTRSATGSKKEYPTWADDQLYDQARMINGALMAKIHTVDWTPAIIAHPTTKVAMRSAVVGPRHGAGQAPLRADQLERGRSAASPARRPTTTACRTR